MLKFFRRAPGRTPDSAADATPPLEGKSRTLDTTFHKDSVSKFLTTGDGCNTAFALTVFRGADMLCVPANYPYCERPVGKDSEQKFVDSHFTPLRYGNVDIVGYGNGLYSMNVGADFHELHPNTADILENHFGRLGIVGMRSDGYFQFTLTDSRQITAMDEFVRLQNERQRLR